ncbi:paired domain-containing protein [Trichonephila clavipes]|nr:paired domain-containing protein [Trichonephila clavipes]
MSQRRRLNSLRWRAVGWMEMGLSQAETSQCVFVVQRLWDYQSEDSVSRRPVPGRPRAAQHLQKTVFFFRHEGEEPLLCRQLVADHFQASGRRILRYYGAKSSSQVCMRNQLCAFPQRTTEGTAYAGQENMFLGRSNNGLSPDLQWRVIQGVY